MIWWMASKAENQPNRWQMFSIYNFTGRPMYTALILAAPCTFSAQFEFLKIYLSC